MTTPGALEQDGITTDDAGRLTTELACIKCAYNLRTLHLDAACPECGTAVGRSVEGNRLRYCDPAWLKQIWEGLNCFGVAVVAAIVFNAVNVRSSRQDPLLLLVVPLATAMGVAIYGFVKATHADPANIDREMWVSPRRLARVALFAALALFAGLLLMAVVVAAIGTDDRRIGTLSTTLMSMMLASLTLGGVMLLAHAARLALRLPNYPLAAAVIFIATAIAGVSAMGVILIADPLWEMMDHLSLYGGYRAWTWRRWLTELMHYPMIALAVAMVLLLIWYWWALSRAARHAWATWAKRRGEAD